MAIADRPRRPLGRWILRLIPDRAIRRLIAADLDEEFGTRADRGSIRARWWYARMAAASVGSWWVGKVATKRDRSSRHSRVSDLRLDVRHAFRLIKRSPLVSVTVVLIMVLGLGSTAGVSSVLVNVLLRPLPFPESERIVRFDRTSQGAPVGFGVVGLPDMEDWRERSRSMESIAGWSATGVTLTGPGRDPARLRAALVTENFHRVLKIDPVLGRPFVDANHRPGGDLVTILSHGFWRREFGGDPTALGRSLRLNGRSYEIVGILPELAFEYPEDADVWLPMALGPTAWQRSIRGASWLTVVGRVGGGWNVTSAEEELSAIQRQIVVEFPRQNEGQDGVALTPLKTVTVAAAHKPLWLLAAAVGGLLIVACANIGLLLAARAQRRRHEFAVRAAVGGDSERLLRQLFTEALVLAVIGGSIGVAIAPVITDFLVRTYPGGLPRASEVVLDPLILGLSASAVLVAGIAAAMLPWFFAGRRDLAAVLQTRDRTPATTEVRGRRFLTATQLAVAVVFLVGAVLFQRTLSNLGRQDVGFGPTNVLTFDLSLPSARYGDGEAIDRFTDELRERIASIPAVLEVGAVTALPFKRGGIWGGGFRVSGTTDRTLDAMVRISWPGYYTAMRIPIEVGRPIDERDRSGTARVVMLNETAAATAFGTANAVGRMVEFEGESWEIVGVAADIRHAGLGNAVAPEIHLPGLQFRRNSFTMAIRFAGDPTGVQMGAREAVKLIDPELAVTDVATMEERIRASVAEERFRAILMTGIGLALTAVTLVGIYGIAASGVVERRREIGVRLALGADRTRVLVEVLRDSGRLAVTGLLIGVALAVMSGRYIREFLFEIDAVDPVVLIGTPVALLGISLLSALPAALRASRSDPAVVLRDE